MHKDRRDEHDRQRKPLLQHDSRVVCSQTGTWPACVRCGGCGPWVTVSDDAASGASSGWMRVGRWRAAGGRASAVAWRWILDGAGRSWSTADLTPGWRGAIACSWPAGEKRCARVQQDSPVRRCSREPPAAIWMRHGRQPRSMATSGRQSQGEVDSPAKRPRAVPPLAAD